MPAAGFEVRADTFAPAVGEPALVPVTPTASEFPLSEITTDPEPDPAFYALSLDEAIGNGRRTVIVFSVRLSAKQRPAVRC